MRQGKSFFLLAGVMMFLLVGCKDKSSLLVRTWKIEDLQYTTEVPESVKPSIKRSIDELKRSFTLTYNADGTYSTKMSGEVLKGKWKLNWNSAKITSTTDKGESKEYKVVELTEDKYSFEAKEGEQTVRFVMVPAQ